MTRHPSTAKWKKGIKQFYGLKKVVRNKYGGDYIYTHTLTNRNGNGILTPLPSSSDNRLKYFWLFGFMGINLQVLWL